MPGQNTRVRVIPGGQGPGVVTSPGTLMQPAAAFGDIELDIAEVTTIAAALLGSRIVFPPIADPELMTQAFEAAALRGGFYLLVPGGDYALLRTIRYRLTGIPFDFWCPDPRNRAVIRNAAGWAPAAGSADDRNNAFFRLEGSSSATISTTLAGGQSADTRRIPLTAGGASAFDGLWLRIISSVGGLVVFEEIVKASGVANGSGVPLYTPLCAPHVNLSTVESVNVPEDIGFRNISFVSNANIACAVAARNAHRIFIDECSGEGFSRAILDFQGSRGIFVGRLHDYGSNNELVMCNGVHAGQIGSGDWTYKDAAPRFHPTAGLRRGKVRAWMGCGQLVLDPGLLGRGVKAVEVTANYGVMLKEFSSFDFRPDQTNDTEWGGTYIGSAFDGDPHNGNYSVFGVGLHMSGGLAVNHRGANTADVLLNAPVTWSIHDQLHANIGLLTHCASAYSAGGLSFFVPTGATVNGDSDYQTRGLAVVDSNGNIVSCVEDGSDQELGTGNLYADVNIPAFYGNGTNLLKRTLCFSHTAINQGPHIQLCTLEDGFIGPIFEAGFADWNLHIGRLLNNGIPFTDVFAASFTGGSPATGFGVQADGAATAGVRKAKAAALGDVAPWVVASPNYGGAVGAILAAPLPGVLNTVKVNAAAVPGQFLSAADAAGNFAVGGAVTYDQAAGRVVVGVGGAGNAYVGA